MTAIETNPSRTSYYVNDSLYQSLMDEFSDWQQEERAVTDMGIRDTANRLLFREARLLDQLKYETWLEMLTPQCIYWVPGRTEASDPRREIAITFEDRRRLEDRIFRLNTNVAWSQAPASRTVRHVTNVEVFKGPSPTTFMVRSNFLISEFWGDEIRYLSGWNGYKMAGSPDDWKIEVKQVNLINADQPIRNLSIVLG